MPGRMRRRVSLDSRNAHVVPRRFLALFLIALLMTLSGYSVAQADTPAISKAKADAQALSDLINKLDDDLSKATENYDYSNARSSKHKRLLRRLRPS